MIESELLRDFEPVATATRGADLQYRVRRNCNLREEASLKAAISALVNAGALVHVIGEDGDWWHVQFNGHMAKSLVDQAIDPPQKNVSRETR